MHDFFEELENIEDKNNQSFQRLDEISFGKVKDVFNKKRDFIKKYLSSDKFKNLKNSIRLKLTYALKGDIAAARKELEINKDVLTPEEYASAKEYIDSVEQARKAKDTIDQQETPESKVEDEFADTTLGIKKDKNGIYWVAGKNPAKKITVTAGMSESQKYNWKAGKLDWLAAGDFEAENIVIDFKKEEVLAFTGIWDNGEFRGNKFVSTKNGDDAQFLGGTFNGGEFKSKNSSFKVAPTNFINGLFPYESDSYWGGILGLPDVKSGEQNEGFYITQVKTGVIIKVTSEDGLNYPIKVIKRLDGRSSVFIYELMIEGDGGGRFPIKWAEMRPNWNNMLIAPGKALNLPFVSSKKVESVSIAPNYDKEVETAREPKIFSISRDDFKIPGFVDALRKNGLTKFKINIPDESKESREFFKVFKSDINAGKNKLENSLKVLKGSIADQLQETSQPIQIKGYPANLKWLDMIFRGSEIGPSSEDLNLDPDEERALVYLNGFMKHVYKNIVSSEIKKGLIMAIRDYIGVTSISNGDPVGGSASDKPAEKPEEEQPKKEPEDIKKLAKGLMIKEIREIFRNQDETFFDDSSL